MILSDYLPYLGLQAILILLVLVIVRPAALPWSIWAATGLAYLTVPVALLRTGIAGAVYVGDVLIPLVLVSATLARPAVLFRGLRRAEVLTIAGAVLGVPWLMTSLLVLFGRYQLTEADALYFYHHLLYLWLLAWCVGIALAPEAVRTFVRLQIALIVALAAWGLLHYFGPWDLDFFLAIQSGGTFDMPAPRFGGGFLGLFRGSVGQWFGIGALLSLALVMSESWRWGGIGLLGLLLSAIVILASFSRSGLLGGVAGLGVLLLARGSKRRVAIAVGVFALAGAVVWGVFPAGSEEAMRSRFDPVGGYSGSAEDVAYWARMEAWKSSIDFFASAPGRALTGLGVSADSEIYELVGIYGAHNEFLDLIFRGGLLSLFLLWAFIALVAVRARRMALLRHDERRSVAAIILSLLVADLVFGIGQSAFVAGYAMHTATVLNYLVMGTLLGALARATRPAAYPRDE